MKPIVYSYTFLRNYENCPHKAYRIGILKDLPKEAMTPEMKYGIDVHEALDRYVRKGTPLPADMATFAPYAKYFKNQGAVAEQKVGMTRGGAPCDFFSPDVFLRGKIDVNWPAGEVAWIADYKTGKKREDSFEIELFGLLLAANTGGKFKNIYGRYVWLKTGEIGALHNLSDVAATFKTVQKMAAEIEHNAAAGYWPKKQNPLCGWCQVFDCEFNPRGK